MPDRRRRLALPAPHEPAVLQQRAEVPVPQSPAARRGRRTRREA